MDLEWHRIELMRLFGDSVAEINVTVQYIRSKVDGSFLHVKDGCSSTFMTTVRICYLHVNKLFCSNAGLILRT